MTRATTDAMRLAVANLNGTSFAALKAGCESAASTGWTHILPLPLDVLISIWPMRLWHHVRALPRLSRRRGSTSPSSLTLRTCTGSR